MPLNIDLNIPLDDLNTSNNLPNMPLNIDLNAPPNIDLSSSIEEEDHIVESEFEVVLSNEEEEEDMDEVDEIENLCEYEIDNENEIENISPGMNSTCSSVISLAHYTCILVILFHSICMHTVTSIF